MDSRRRRRSIGRAVERATIIVISVIACLVATPSHAEERLALADVVDAFDQAVLQGQGRVSKWSPDRTLVVKVTADFDANEEAALEAALRMVSQTAHLVLSRDDSAQAPQIVVESADDLGAAAAGTRNVGRTQSSFETVSGEMRAATVSILRNRSRVPADWIRRTMPHEVLHAVGFHGHAPSYFDSVTTLTGSAAGPTVWDLLFLGVLYDTRLPNGAPRIFALPIACRLLHERLAGELPGLISDLRPSGEHPYCSDLSSRPVTATTASERISLSWAYLNGLGVTADPVEAERLARESQRLGDSDAAYLLHRIELSNYQR